MTVDVSKHVDETLMIVSSRDDDDCNGNDDDNNNDDNDDRFLEEMLIKAERLANEMKEISTKHSGANGRTTTAALSSASKDRRRSLPKMIDVHQQDDAARSECSSLGYSLATATPLLLSAPTGTTTPSIKVLSTATAVRDQQHTSTTCSVINEGSALNNHCDEERKSCGGDSSVSRSNKLEHEANRNYYCNQNNENIRNMSSVDIVLQSSVRTPPKVKRTSQFDPLGTMLPLSTTNPALLLTLSTTKSLSEDVVDTTTSNPSNATIDNDEATNKKLVKPVVKQQRPTVLKISQNDDDYVPIADYSIRNTTTPTNTVIWEKVDTPTVEDDDYVSLRDYSYFPSTRTSKTSQCKTRSYNDDYENDGTIDHGRMTFAQQRTLLVRRRRQKKRFLRRLALLMFVAVIAIVTYWYSDDSINTISVINLFDSLQQYIYNSVTLNLGHVQTKATSREVAILEDYKVEDTIDIVTVTATIDIPPNVLFSDSEIEDEFGNSIGNATIQEELLYWDEYYKEDEAEQLQDQQATFDKEASLSTSTSTAAVTTFCMKSLFQLSIFEATERQRYIEELVNSMMQ
jgi:hypothetical protein